MTNVLDVLSQHATFISDHDEADMDAALSEGLVSPNGYEFADFAKRTCLCGERIDGFDEYHAHLRAKIEETIE